MKLNDPNIINPNIPLNEQIYAIVKNEIYDGLWVGRADFPGEQELAERFGVSVITTRRALDRLVEEGVVERSRGRRPKAIYMPPKPRWPIAPTIFPLTSRPFTYTVLRSGVDVGWAEACKAFGLPVGSRLWLLRRLRTFKGRRHSISYNAQLPDLGERHTKSDIAKLPMIALLRRAGKSPARLTRNIGVALPPTDVAENLQIALHDPTLVYTFTLQDDDEKTIEWVRIYIHPDEPSPLETVNFKTGEFILQSP